MEDTMTSQEEAVVDALDIESLEITEMKTPVAAGKKTVKSAPKKEAARPLPDTEKKELAMLAKAASEFARKQLAPDREENDKYPFGPFFDDALAKAFDVDFFHILLPESMNGMSQGITALGVTLENICQEDSSLGGILFTTAAAQELMMAAGADDLLKEITRSTDVKQFAIALPVFNNPSEVRHLALVKQSGNDVTLSGPMEYMVLGGLARWALVPAGNPGSRRYSYYLVDLAGEGVVKSEPILSLGFHACPAVDVELSNAPARLIGEEGKGAEYFEKMADRMHAAGGAMALGVMKGSFREAFEYAKKREQGGQIGRASCRERVS
jgi:alkylation response protein AidB-like acyl-CoA dehydrogenase